MRTLSATLLAAQKKAQRLPFVEARAYDYEQGIKRLTWTKLYAGSEPDNHHGIVFDGQASMHRIRAAAGGLLYYQKVSAPDEASDYATWTQIAADCAGPCAIAAQGASVYIFYRTTGNVLWKCYSGDYGQNWSDAQLAAYADVLSMAAAWWGTGNTVVCFALTANELNAITLNFITQETQQHVWSDINHTLLATYGIGATYSDALGQCEVVFAGKESDSPYNHYDLFRTKLSNTYNFLALESFLAYPEGEDFTLEYPDCHVPAAAQVYETNRILAVEKFAGTTAYTRPLTCHMVKGTSWSDTTFTEPKPFLDDSPSYGLRMSSTSTHWWISRPGGVWRAPRPADSPLDLSGDIVSMSLTQSTQGTQRTQGTLTITLDNSRAQYTPIPPALRFRAEIVLGLGYKTTAGDETSEAGTFWVAGWEYSITQGTQSTLTLLCLDGWGLMQRWSARYQMRWNKDAVNPRSPWQILYQLLARVGIRLTNTPAKPQSWLVNNFYPDFTLAPGTPGTQALNRPLSLISDRLVFRGQEAFTKDPVASEEPCYAYSTNATNSMHPITTGSYAAAVTLSRSRALGRDGSGNRILEEAVDWNLLQLGIDELEQAYDPNLQTTTKAQERAEAILRQMSLRAQRGNLVVPTNCGQELLDVVEVTDDRCGLSAEPYRVQAIRTDYDRRKAVYDQRLTLAAP